MKRSSHKLTVLIARLKMDTAIVEVPAGTPDQVKQAAVRKAVLHLSEYDWLEHAVDEDHLPFVLAVVDEAALKCEAPAGEKPRRAIDALHEALDAQQFVLLARDLRTGVSTVASAPKGDHGIDDATIRAWLDGSLAIRA